MANNNELMHYGRKGMKWGQHIYGQKPTSSGGKTSKSSLAKKLGLAPKKKTPKQVKKKLKEEEKAEAKEAKAKAKEQTKPRNVKTMSDAELQAAVKRLKAEKEYKELTANQMSAGKKFTKVFVEKMVSPAVEDIGKQLVKSGLTYTTNRVLDLPGDYKIYTNNKKKS